MSKWQKAQNKKADEIWKIALATHLLLITVVECHSLQSRILHSPKTRELRAGCKPALQAGKAVKKSILQFVRPTSRGQRSS